MAWRHQATSYYLILCWPRSMLPYGVTRPQWVNLAQNRITILKSELKATANHKMYLVQLIKILIHNLQVLIHVYPINKESKCGTLNHSGMVTGVHWYVHNNTTSTQELVVHYKAATRFSPWKKSDTSIVWNSNVIQKWCIWSWWYILNYGIHEGISKEPKKRSNVDDIRLLNLYKAIGGDLSCNPIPFCGH